MTIALDPAKPVYREPTRWEQLKVNKNWLAVWFMLPAAAFLILFLALSEVDLIQILELMVTQLNANLAQKSITVTVADEAKKWILHQTLTDRSYGARPLRRALQKYIEDPLSEALIQGTITTRPAFIEVFLEDNKLFYRPVDAEKTEGVLLYEN